MTLRQLRAIFRRELAAYFLSPMSWLVAAAFLVANGFLFASGVRDGGSASLGSTFDSVSFLLLVVAPLLTMRLVAEELRSGTLEILLTDPLGEATIILGKFAAAWVFLLLLILPTVAYPVILWEIGWPDPGPILASYIGLVLMGAVFVAVGLACSAALENPVAAAAVAFALLFLSWVLGRATRGVNPGPLRDALEYVAAFRQFDDFRNGVVDTRSMVWYASVVGLALFAATQALGLRRLR
jgi:ABC-2 type transport system permease protein